MARLTRSKSRKRSRAAKKGWATRRMREGKERAEQEVDERRRGRRRREREYDDVMEVEEGDVVELSITYTED